LVSHVLKNSTMSRLTLLRLLPLAVMEVMTVGFTPRFSSSFLVSSISKIVGAI
jgi:hypothetical protein